jgi:class 3 adenylate cyclase
MIFFVFFTHSSFLLFCFSSTATSNAIVLSLFPEAVKKQLMETQPRNQRLGDTLPKGKLKAFLNDGSKNSIALGCENGDSDDFAVKNAKQIAELFPETTIMFADIAGFTGWASSREPSHVFTLLETLYGAFDRQARGRGELVDCGRVCQRVWFPFSHCYKKYECPNVSGMFKVETIGDCYVAVFGLPESNKHHALKMAKFASACLDEILPLSY